MKLWISPYSLNSTYTLNSRQHDIQHQGILIKVSNDDDHTHGYSSLQPWPVLGDESLEAEINRLKKRKVSRLSKQAIQQAQTDAIARSNQVSLFENISIPASHFICPNLDDLSQARIDHLQSQGFQYIKIKVGRDWQKELQQLKRLNWGDLKLRLDFNNALDEISMNALLEEADTLLTQLDYIEDPCHFNPSVWNVWRKEFGIRLARDFLNFDHDINPNGWDLLIMKPAINDHKQCAEWAESHNKQVVVTSYAGHAVEQLHSAYVAAWMQHHKPTLLHACGILSHQAYQADEFFKQVQTDGPYLEAPEGYGIGFDNLLEAQAWQEI